MTAELTIVGKPMPRVDARDKVTGKAIFGVDVHLPGMLAMKVLGSAYAHAEIVSIDTSRARKLPGVVAVITGDDLPHNVELNFGSRGHSFLAKHKAFFYGQPVAAVAAVDIHTAEEALKYIDVKYRPLPILLDPLEAMKPDAPLIQHMGEGASEMSMHNADVAEDDEDHTEELDKEDIGDSDIREAAELASEAQAEAAPRNVASHIVFKQGDVAKGFAESDVVIENTYRLAQVHQGYLELQNATANWDAVNQQLTLWVSTQAQFYERQHAAEVLGLPIHKVKVITPEVGGGFGAKFGLVAPLVGLMSMKAGRPVQHIYTRHEELQASNPAPASVITIKTGCKKDGTLTAIEAKVVVDTGAYSGSPMSIICIMLAAPYKFPNIFIDGYEVLTNKQSVAAYRAPGGPNSSFAIEQQIDIMANEVGMSALEFRLLNGSEEGYTRPDGTPQPKIGLRAVLNALARHPIWKEPLGPNQGRGLAIGGWGGGRGPASAIVKLEGDGTFEVVVGTVDLTGTNTSFAQIAAEVLGLPISKIHVTRLDTETAPFGPAAGGSQVTYSMGVAVIEAAKDARSQVLKVAAKEFDTTEDDIVLDEVGLRSQSKPDKKLSWPQFQETTSGWTAKYAPVLGRGSVERRKGAPGYAACVADVEVDPLTGYVKILRVVAAQDVGKAINRMSVEGQLQGGTVQGIGLALWEEIMYGADGRVRNASLLDYRKATPRDLPLIDAVIVEQASDDGPFGAKIVGEPSIIPPAGALANAVAAATGKRIFELPLTAERIARAMGRVQEYDAMTTIAPTLTPGPSPIRGEGRGRNGRNGHGRTNGKVKTTNGRASRKATARKAR
ncbi:MAG: xanthine dehydrogenase family protein molybdopterin-binding subunit [Chloroflexi bacterium]|nr:xanthine dehydrogenase family protein molybdopterin-binding subunit [Chloroflexota bacterium]